MLEWLRVFTESAVTVAYKRESLESIETRYNELIALMTNMMEVGYGI